MPLYLERPLGRLLMGSGMGKAWVGPRAAVGWIARIRPGTWLWVAMAAYFVVSFAYSWLRALELQTTTWDMGIYQQALWSTAHGRPFYEAADAETGGYGSFLQVHSAYVLYLLVPIYDALPYQTTLFVVQSAVVAAASYPLYLLGSDATGSPRLGLVAGVMYLAWAPTLASNLYDFHIEAFLPVELFAFVLLWNRGRYGWGLAVAFVAFATMEIAPVLLFFVGLYFLLPDAGSVRAALVRPPGGISFRVRSAVRWLRARRFVLASAGLMLLCLVAYYVDLLLRERYLAPLLGVSAFPSTNSGYVVGGTLGELGLLVQNVGVGFTTKLTAWLVLLALLGFVPLFAPRALVLALPWLGFTFLSSSLNYVTIGFQYGFIEASSLLVAFAFGLGGLARAVRSRAARPARHGSRTSGRAVAPASAGPAPLPSRSRGLPRGLWVVGFVLLLAVNVAASPVDPALQGMVGLGSAYQLTDQPPAGYGSVQELVGLMPPGATVLASDNLFPLVANDLNAYSIFWAQDNHLMLPFHGDQLPTFVLVSEDRTYAVPDWLSPTLYNASDYGLRGIAWSTPVGAVVLFQAGFSGTATQIDPPTPSVERFSGAALDPQGGGALLATSDYQYPEVVESVAGGQGPIWAAPHSNLPVGEYTVTVGLVEHLAAGVAPPPPNTSVLLLNVGSFAEPVWYQSTLPYSALNGSGWVPVEFPIAVTEPALQVEVRGYLSDPSVEVEVAYLEIAPAS
jgi:uncharacterized membrane protein